MAAPGGAGQYEDAFRPHRLQLWGVTRPARQPPSPREGSTRILADARGHLLPTVPRSRASPWGTFVGTWEMPPRIPPARLDLTSRSAAATARLLAWVRQPSTLTRACNGLQTQLTGKPQEPQLDTETPEEPPRRSSPAPSEGPQPMRTRPEQPLDQEPGHCSPPSAAVRGPGGSQRGPQSPQLCASLGPSVGHSPRAPSTLP